MTRVRSLLLASVAGVFLGVLAGVVWLAADALGNTGLHYLGTDIRARVVFSDWITPVIGLGIALGTGYLSARIFRNAPLSGAAGVAVGLLAVFILPQALIRGDVSLYPAGPEMFFPTILGLPILAVIGGRLGRRVT